jgi:hypothetical protein
MPAAAGAVVDAAAVVVAADLVQGAVGAADSRRRQAVLPALRPGPLLGLARQRLLVRLPAPDRQLALGQHPARAPQRGLAPQQALGPALRRPALVRQREGHDPAPATSPVELVPRPAS